MSTVEAGMAMRRGYRGPMGQAFFPSRAASRLIGALVAPLPPLLKHVTDNKRKQR